MGPFILNPSNLTTFTLLLQSIYITLDILNLSLHTEAGHHEI